MAGRRLLSAALLVALASGAAACGGGGGTRPGPVDRVLVVSVPGVAWHDLPGLDLPALERFVDEAAVADLATRIGRRGADLTDAYLTMSAGSRALAPPEDAGAVVGPDDRYGGVPASEVMRRRVGEAVDGLAYLAIGAARDVNEDSEFGADIGTLGDELAELGVHRAAVANADHPEEVPDADLPDEVEGEAPFGDRYWRAAATALMGSDGTLPGGSVSRSLLVADREAPYGLRLDQGAVLDAFDEAWATEGRAVVVVEASDLARADAYRPLADPSARARMRRDALHAADDLLAALLDRVDAEHTAVLVLSPVAPPGAPSLALAALRAPGVPAGYLRSATTRRDGYVELADVAPTIVSLLGEGEMEGIDGAPFEVTATSGSDRVGALADAAEAADVRDDMVPAVSIAFVVVLALLTAATLARTKLPGAARRLLVPLALAVVGAVPGTFLVGSLGLLSESVAAYTALVVLVGALVALAAGLAERWAAGTGLIVAVGALVALIVLDVVVGAPLQVNTVFGYSVAVAGRFAGLGNLAYALLGSGAVVLAALLAERFGRRGVTAGVVVLAVVALVDGLPMLGADVGGLLSMVPAFGLTALILLGRPVRPRHLVLLGVAGVVGVLTFAFIDLARPSEARTHLARLARHVLDGRWGPFFDTMGRRWEASFGGAELAAWAAIGLLSLAAAGYVVLVVQGRAGPGARPLAVEGPAAAAGAGLAVLALIGLVANDSSVAVPGMMLIVVVPVLVVRTVRRPRSARPRSSGGAA